MRQLQYCLFQIAAHVFGATGVRGSTLVQIVGQIEAVYYRLWKRDESIRKCVDGCLQAVAASDAAIQKAAAAAEQAEMSQEQPSSAVRVVQRAPATVRAPVSSMTGAVGSAVPTAPVASAPIVSAPVLDSGRSKHVNGLRTSLRNLRHFELALLSLPDPSWREKLSGLLQSRLQRVEA